MGTWIHTMMAMVITIQKNRTILPMMTTIIMMMIMVMTNIMMMMMTMMMILQVTNKKPLKKIRASMIERISNEINKTLMVSMPTNEVASGTTIKHLINIQFQIITSISISISKQTIMDKYL